MNLDEIENLTEDLVNELYEDEFFNNSDKLSVCICSSCSRHRETGYYGSNCAPFPGIHDESGCNSACRRLGCNVYVYDSLCYTYDYRHRVYCGETYSQYGICR